jgi:hypothetical protein
MIIWIIGFTIAGFAIGYGIGRMRALDAAEEAALYERVELVKLFRDKLDRQTKA